MVSLSLNLSLLLVTFFSHYKLGWQFLKICITSSDDVILVTCSSIADLHSITYLLAMGFLQNSKCVVVPDSDEFEGFHCRLSIASFPWRLFDGTAFSN